MLETLERSGVSTALFVSPPPPADETDGHPRAVGIAGATRGMSPSAMDAALTPALAALRDLAPLIVHYKVCSTFDSSPQSGSIGRAIEIGQTVFKNRVTVLLVAAPALQRYCAFGNLFARNGVAGDVTRLDRLEGMASHPVTPMNEADLRRHLAFQTKLPTALVDVLTLDQGVDAALAAFERAPDGAIVLVDALHDRHLETAGHVFLRLQQRENRTLFIAGSSGVECALLAACGLASGIRPDQPRGSSCQADARPHAAGSLVVLAGSCSPVTRRQVKHAVEHGFAAVELNLPEPGSDCAIDAELSLAADAVARHIQSGQSVVVHTGERLLPSAHGACVGEHLGHVLLKALLKADVSRLVVAGGDTSGQVARTLGIESIRFVLPLEPGAPLCSVRSSNPRVDRMEVTFKGGQIGGDDFLLTTRDAIVPVARCADAQAIVPFRTATS